MPRSLVVNQCNARQAVGGFVDGDLPRVPNQPVRPIERHVDQIVLRVVGDAEHRDPFVDNLIAQLDPSIVLVDGGERIRRGHTNGPIRVALPDGYLDHLDDTTIPDDSHVMALSGG